MADKQKLLWESSGGIIPEGWSLVSLSSLLKNPKSMSVGVMYPGKHFDDGIPLIRVSDVKNGGVASKPDFCISVDVDEEYKRTRLSGEELLITLVGNPGDCVIATQEMSGWNAARAIAVLRLEDVTLRQWVRIVLLSGPSKHIIDSRLNTTVQKTLNLKDIRELPIPMPPASLRESLCAISKKFEEKCLINHQTNQTLEQMAQALFKSWFVDFDPVFDNLLASVDFKLENLETSLPNELKQKAQRRLAALNSLENAAEIKASLIALAHELQAQLPTKEATQAAVQVSEKTAETPVKANFNANPNILAQHANTHAHFPNEFEHNEQLGWIPKGWEVCALGDKVTVKRGGSPRPIKDYIVSDGLPWTKISDATASTSRFIKNTKEYIKPEGLKKTTLLKKGTLILSNSATPGLPKFLDLDACIHDGWLHFPIKETFSDLYLYQLFLVVRKELVQQGNGSVFTNLKTDILKNHNVVVPSELVLQRFDEFIKPQVNKIHSLSASTLSLEKLRDTLLPKLISGELQILDVATDEEVVD